METIYKIIQEHPGYFAWAFGLVNALWIAFTYFNSQRHDRELRNLEQRLRLDADRRLKVFELKATQYESYVTNLDAFGKKNQTDLPKRMQPIFDRYFKEYLEASAANNKEREAAVITWFGSQISSLMQESAEDYFRLQAESSKLKLTSTDEMIECFDQLETLIKKSMDESQEFMGRFTAMVMSQDFSLAEQFQAQAQTRGEEIKAASRKLLELMRAELNKI